MIFIRIASIPDQRSRQFLLRDWLMTRVSNHWNDWLHIESELNDRRRIYGGQSYKLLLRHAPKHVDSTEFLWSIWFCNKLTITFLIWRWYYPRWVLKNSTVNSIQNGASLFTQFPCHLIEFFKRPEFFHAYIFFPNSQI